jgi:mono/diheme cytochrome c family protein
MSKGRSFFVLLFAAATFAALGCHGAPGKPGPDPEVPRPDHVLDFATLYKQNCVACHGDAQQPGAAISLANPVFLAIAGQGDIKMYITSGVDGKLMPAFARSAGGMLTAQQVDILAKGLISTWGKPGLLDGQNPPPFEAAGGGDPTAGARAYATYCARCHGDSGAASTNPKVGSIVDPPYLALISDQELRNFVIAGATGMPDWRSDSPGHPMSDKEITDVVAWLGSHRINPAPATPAPMPQPNQGMKSSKVKTEPSSIR